MVRDFTYIDDVVESITRLINIDYRDKKPDNYLRSFNISRYLEETD